MNERMIKLYEQALEFTYDNVSKEIWNTDNFHAIVAGKFAELIVQECVELSVNSQYVNTKSEYYEGFNEALIYASNKIKKHFGVEE